MACSDGALNRSVVCKVTYRNAWESRLESDRRTADGVAVLRTAPDAPILEVDDLQTHFFTPAGVIRGGRRRVLLSSKPAKRWAWSANPAAAKASTALSILRLVASPPGRIVGGAIRFEGTQPARSARDRDGSHPRQRHLDDLPGADDLAQSAATRPASRSARRSRCIRACRGKDAMDGAVEMLRRVSHPRTGAARAGLSAPIVRRHAAARDDRHGAVLQSEGADRR